MAEKVKAIKLADGTVTNLVDKKTKLSVNYRPVTTYYDGSAMTNAKVDGDLYIKNGTTFYRKVIDKDGELFLEKDTMAQMRALTVFEILLLKAGVYKGVKLNGYYTKGDTPNPIEYVLSTTSEDDDGGSVIEAGGVKLEHDFGGVVDALYYGSVINQDSTEFINKAVEKTKRVIISKPFKVAPQNIVGNLNSYSGGVILQNNSELIFTAEGLLYIDAQPVGRYTIINVTGKDGVYIENPRIIGDVDTHEGTTGEWGHGISLYSSSNFRVVGGNISKCWGDGIAVAADALLQVPCSGGTIENAVCDDNRRQGMSIMSWVKGTVNGGVFKNTGKTKTTAPSFGIDIEPNPQGYDAIDVVINNVVTENNLRGGIQCTPAFLTAPTNDTNPNGRLYNVVINNHSSVNDGILGGFRFANPELTDINVDITKKIRGSIVYNSPTIRDSQRSSIRIERHFDSGLELFLNNVNIVNPSTVRSSSPLINNVGIYITTNANNQTSAGAVYINNINISDNRPSILMELPIVYDSPTVNINKFKVTGLSVTTGYQNSTFGDVYMVGNNTGTIEYKGDTIASVSAPLVIPDGSKYNAKIINVTTAGAITLPLNNAINTILTFRYRAPSGNISINPNTLQKIDFFGATSNNEGVILRGTRDSITLQFRGGVWQVLSFTGATHLSGRTSAEINRSFISNAGVPTVAPKWYNDEYFDNTNKTWYKSSGLTLGDWVPLNAIKQSAFQADISATDVAGVVAWINQFMAKYRASGQGASS